jgi:hypothetical protein
VALPGEVPQLEPLGIEGGCRGRSSGTSASPIAARRLGGGRRFALLDPNAPILERMIVEEPVR